MRQTRPDGLSGVCGPGCEVEQCPVPVALEEPIEPLRELPRGLRVLVGAGEHPGPREDFASGVLFALWQALQHVRDEIAKAVKALADYAREYWERNRQEKLALERDDRGWSRS